MWQRLCLRQRIIAHTLLTRPFNHCLQAEYFEIYFLILSVQYASFQILIVNGGNVIRHHAAEEREDCDV